MFNQQTVKMSYELSHVSTTFLPIMSDAILETAV